MRRLAAVIAGLILGASSAARASDAFDAFNQSCVLTHAKADAAISAADNNGWTPVPDAMLASLSKASPISAPQGRMRRNNAGTMFLLAGTGKILQLGGSLGNICTVVTFPAEPALDGEAALFAAVPKDPKVDGVAAYYWHEQDGRHFKVSGVDADARAELRKGPIQLLTQQTRAKMSLVMLVVVSR